MAWKAIDPVARTRNAVLRENVIRIM